MFLTSIISKMKKIKVKKRKEKKLIWNKTKHYIILWIVACCLIVSVNIHPTNIEPSSNSDMIYIFHDYERNKYILNESTHGSSDELDYLLDDSIPENIKWKDYSYTNSVSLENLEAEDINDNQISIENIMNELWIDDSFSWDITIVDDSKDTWWEYENTLIIDLSNNSNEIVENNNLYNVTNDWSILTIKKSKSIVSYNNINTWNNSNNKGTIVKSFKTIPETWVLPSLISLNQLEDLNYKDSISNSNNSTDYNDGAKDYENSKNIGWVNILPDYADCMTPRWYKISHWESVLAYKQLDNAPNVCNIERRFCRNWKLSWTYPQEWCYTNENYTYTQRNDLENSTKTVSNSSKKNNNSQKWFTVNEEPTIELNTKQNKDGSVTVYKPETTWSFVFDWPSQTYTNIHNWEDNIEEFIWIEQTRKQHANCITSRWEEVAHWQIIQAFKHANGFYDIPCQTQIRLCSDWKLNGSYEQESCRHWESSFVDRFNGSANNDKYYKEKLKKIKQKIKYEEEYYKELKWLSEEEALDKIFYLLDE